MRVEQIIATPTHIELVIPELPLVSKVYAEARLPLVTGDARRTHHGKIVAVTTQVQNEGSDLAVYNVGHSLKNDLGVLESYDMTIEAVVAKLMWALGVTQDNEEVAKLFYTPVGNDII